MAFDTLRTNLNEYHDMIRPFIFDSLVNLIRSAENNNEQHVVQDIHNMIRNLIDMRMSQNESIQIYMESLNTQNSSTRQFLERFFAPRIVVNMQELELQQHEIDLDQAVAPGIVPRN
jgi:hypothetical protein